MIISRLYKEDKKPKSTANRDAPQLDECEQAGHRQRQAGVRLAQYNLPMTSSTDSGRQ